MIGGLCDFWTWQVPHTEGYCVIFPCWMAHHTAMTQCVDINHTSQGLCFGLANIYIYVSISMDCFDMFWPYIRGVMIHSLFSSRNELHWPLVGSILSNHQFKRCFIQTNTIWGALYQNSHFNGVYDGQPWHLWVFPQFFDKNKSLSNKLIKHVSHSPWFYPKKISNISQNFPLPLSHSHGHPWQPMGGKDRPAGCIMEPKKLVILWIWWFSAGEMGSILRSRSEPWVNIQKTMENHHF
jgi:hypothetical protein